MAGEVSLSQALFFSQVTNGVFEQTIPNPHIVPTQFYFVNTSRPGFHFR